MRVTPVNKKFGKYAPGDEFDFPDKAAKVFVKLGKLSEVKAGLVYQTRMMQAAPVTGPVVNGHGAVPVEPAPVTPVATPAVVAEPEQPEAETDSENVAWDATLHVASKLKNTDGTWRKKPGARAAS